MRLNFRQQYALVCAGAMVLGAGAILLVRPESFYGVLAMAGFAILCGLVVGRQSARRLRQSIGRLRETADAIGSGDFSQRVTERPGDELAKLTEAFNRMADRLEQMADEDRALREKLAQTEKLAMIGELAATVAHEVNNPLDGIQNCTRIIRRDPQNADQVRRMLDLMDGGLYRIEMIVRRLLSMARDEAMNLAPTPVDEIIDDALMFIQPRLDRRGVQLERARGDRPVFVLADRTQMAQVLINLLLNAVDSCLPGGRIRVHVREPGPDSPCAGLVIEDNGQGIAPELLSRIFEPFFTTKRGLGTGTGLGLAVVKRIVDAHNGRVEVESRVGEGTRFAISLPAAPVGVAVHESDSGTRASRLVSSN